MKRMMQLNSVLKEKRELFLKRSNDINDNKNISNCVINDINGQKRKISKYALDRSRFIPNTEKTQLADEIASAFNDLDNYAGFLSVVNKIGASEARTLFKVVQSDIQEKSITQTPVRNPSAYFFWMFKKKFYKKMTNRQINNKPTK